MSTCIRVALVLSVLAGVASGQRAGDTPPALVWDSLKGTCPASLDWADLWTKVVVISLNALDAYPEEIVEWNKAPEKFQEEPVVFIRVVSGSEFLLDQALARTPYRGCILFDRKRANAENFGIRFWFDRTIVVDDRGRIAGYNRSGPKEQEDAIRAVLNHKADASLSTTPPQPSGFNPRAGVNPPPFSSVEISPAAKGARATIDDLFPNQIILRNGSLKLIIQVLWGTPPTRIVLPGNLDGGNYDLTASIPDGNRDRLVAMVRSAVERRFGLSIASGEQRLERVYVMTVAQEPSRHLRPAKDDDAGGTGGGEQSIFGTGQTMQDIASVLEEILNTPVIDNTNLAGKYDYSAISKLSGTERAFDMARQLGLELVQEERQIEMLVVRKIQ